MSAYENFIRDFPKRCEKLLNNYQKRSKLEGLEVTFMLSIASAGFTVPFERIRQPSKDKQNNSVPHPSGDRERYTKASEQIDEFFIEKFVGSTLCKEIQHSWCFGELASHRGDPDCWPEMGSPKKISKNKTVGPILKHFRNALAHGNIYTIGGNISRIIFLSEHHGKTGSFDYLSVSPDDFCTFLQGWFAFVKKLELPTEAAEGFIEEDDERNVVNG